MNQKLITRSLNELGYRTDWGMTGSGPIVAIFHKDGPTKDTPFGKEKMYVTGYPPIDDASDDDFVKCIDKEYQRRAEDYRRSLAATPPTVTLSP